MTAGERPVIAAPATYVTFRVVLTVLAIAAVTSCGSENLERRDAAKARLRKGQ